MLASLTDPELAPHIDRSRISILGWSSGGNLACKQTFPISPEKVLQHIDSII